VRVESVQESRSALQASANCRIKGSGDCLDC
jgi:hypothetical protein